MEKEKRPLKEVRCSGEEKTNPQAIQEYEFFVQGRVGEAEEASFKGKIENGSEGKEGGQSKSRVFFSSGDETDG